jgi:cyclophilin family peptidyl-prolyl cis-trans isomerase/HEAT repeat protein
MIKRFVVRLLLSLAFSSSLLAQVPVSVGVQILKAEDARRYDKTLEGLMKSPNAAIRKRAALAAGRIGDERAIGALSDLLEKDPNVDVRAMAAFAVGETESIKAADIVLKEITAPSIVVTLSDDPVHARLVEAAGKIAAANPKDDKSKALGEVVVGVLNSELSKQSAPDVTLIRLALTAVLRARPAGGEETVRKFLAYTDPNIVGDALNTLARLRAKNANRDARDLMSTSVNAVVRANAARVLAASEDKESLDALVKAATSDSDLRVRVSAVRALGNLKEQSISAALLLRGGTLMAAYKKSKYRVPVEKGELLEIITSLGRLLAGTNDDRAVKFIREFREADKIHSPETEIAFARIAPAMYVNSFSGEPDWAALAAEYQGLGEIARLDATTAPAAKQKARIILVQEIAQRFNSALVNDVTLRSRPDLVRAFAAFKSENTSNIIRPLFEDEKDLFVRAAMAEVLAEQPATKENADALKSGFDRALITDKYYNDAQLSILDAIYKIDKKEAVGTLLIALNSPDYLVRKKAFGLLNDKDLQKDLPNVATSLQNAKVKLRDEVLPHAPGVVTKQGQILNTDADYRRALSRRNGHVRAVVTTEKGSFTINLLPEDAPLTVDNFVKLAKANYFNGFEVHRVVPNFVVQDGDPRGEGNGGPGWSIRCEINMVPYERGAVGMALSGKDTGGSQWFVTHSPQPHLDGGYTVFGQVNETDMKVVDTIERGDKVLSVRIVEAGKN